MEMMCHTVYSRPGKRSTFDKRQNERKTGLRAGVTCPMTVPMAYSPSQPSENFEVAVAPSPGGLYTSWTVRFTAQD
jgi:hypothetical protein